MLPKDHRCENPLSDGPPVTLIGYWEGVYEPGWPSVTEFVDQHWDQAQRDLVARYLEQGFIVPWGYAGWSDCRFCGAINGTREQTDYVYLWPEGLAHYVREHGVRLPDRVIRHIVSRSHLRMEDVTSDWWRTATLGP